MATKKTPRAGKATPKPKDGVPPRSATQVTDPKDKATLQAIETAAADIHSTIDKRRKPELKMPVRALSNVSYDVKKGFLEIGKDKKIRSLSVTTVKSFAQTLKMMALSAEMVRTNEHATKRDAYYQSKNWGDARFEEQEESDTVMDDIEAMFSTYGVTREELRYVPDTHGGSVAGELRIVDRDIDGEINEIDCTKMGSGSYTIPSSVEHLQFKTKAKFILAIETAGMFDRLQRQKYWQSANCILISMGGVPTRACRRFIRRLSEDAKIPVYAFTDCDPYGFANIYRTLKVGSGNAAHINKFFCVPEVTYLGLTPQDVIEYGLEKATHPLGTEDVKRAQAALKNDPFFQSHKQWKTAIEMLLKNQWRAEQQALSLHGLNFVIEEYLPKKLKQVNTFLP